MSPQGSSVPTWCSIQQRAGPQPRRLERCRLAQVAYLENGFAVESHWEEAWTKPMQMWPFGIQGTLLPSERNCDCFVCLFVCFILYWFQVCSLVIRQSYTVHTVPLKISSTLTGIIRIYHNILDCIPYAYLLLCDYFLTSNWCFLVSSQPTPPLRQPPGLSLHLWIGLNFVYFVL